MGMHFNNLTSDEVLANMISDREFGLTIKRYLDPTFLPSKEHQNIYNAINVDFFNTGASSWGSVYQQLGKDQESQKLLMKMKELDVNTETSIKSVERFLLDKKAREVYDKFGRLYSQNKHEEAQKVMREFSLYENSLSIHSEMVTGLIETIDETETERKNSVGTTPLTTGIRPLDHYTFGGIREKELWMFMADSGGGKSTLLRYIGIEALKQGKRVLHFQAEDSREACLNLYKSTLFAVNSSEFMFNSLSNSQNKKIEEQIKTYKKTIANDLYVVAFEQFGSASILDCYNIAKKMTKKYGQFDLILFDYLDEFEAGDGKKYSTNADGLRAQKSSVLKSMKNIALELNTRVITATQSMDIKLDNKNNPSFFLTRENIAENKALVRPLNMFCTINQTYSELETNEDRDYEVVRMFIDKYRTGKDKILFTVAQRRNQSQFYLDDETCSNYWDIHSKSPMIYTE
jgi:replicative DNA helicase